MPMCQEVYKFATKLFTEELNSNNEAQQYLSKRGFDIDFLRQFDVGFAEGNLVEKIKGKGFSKGQVLNSRLIAERKQDGQLYDFFRQRIMFPITIFGNIVFMSGRDTTGEAHSKYINIPNPNIFWANEELLQYQPEWIILTEGYMDCYSLLQHDFPAIGMTNCNRKSEILLKKLISIKRVFIMFDYDCNNAGQVGAAKTAYNLIGVGHSGVKICEIPHYGNKKMDINELMLLSGSGFKDRINQVLAVAEKEAPLFHQSRLYQEMFKKEQSKEKKYSDLTPAESIALVMKWVGRNQITYDHDDYIQFCCPLHGETKGSFTVYKKAGNVVCYGCGFTGSGEDFDREMRKRNESKYFD